jgi:hypothetical protein
LQKLSETAGNLLEFPGEFLLNAENHQELPVKQYMGKTVQQSTGADK